MTRLLTYTMALAFLVLSASVSLATVSTRAKLIAGSITTDTTSAARGTEPDYKSIWGQVICDSGACTQTQAVYGDIDDDAANGLLLCTLTLSDTTRDQDACPPITAALPFLYVVTTNTSGTNATGAVYATH